MVILITLRLLPLPLLLFRASPWRLFLPRTFPVICFIACVAMPAPRWSVPTKASVVNAAIADTWGWRASQTCQIKWWHFTKCPCSLATFGILDFLWYFDSLNMFVKLLFSKRTSENMFFLGCKSESIQRISPLCLRITLQEPKIGNSWIIRVIWNQKETSNSIAIYHRSKWWIFQQTMFDCRKGNHNFLNMRFSSQERFTRNTLCQVCLRNVSGGERNNDAGLVSTEFFLLFFVTYVGIDWTNQHWVYYCFFLILGIDQP